MENIDKKNEVELRELYQVHDMSIVVNNQSISPEGYTLTAFEMFFKENTHTQIVMKLKIREDYLKEWYFYSKESLDLDLESIEITLQLQGRKYFSGIIQKLSMREYFSNEHEIEIIIKSKSELMDRNKVYRVFQNPKLTYSDLINEILKRYDKKINVIGIENTFLSKEIDGIIVQYYETDWEFLIRLISHHGTAVFNTENGGITLGLSKNTSATKNWVNLKGNLYKITEKTRTHYEGQSLGFYICGDYIENIKSEGEKIPLGFTTAGKIIFKDGKFIGNYTLKPQDYIYSYIYNENIKGHTIEGKVKRLPMGQANSKNIALMTVDFSNGLKKTVEYKNKKVLLYEVILGQDYYQKNNKIERFKFPYVTPYSKSKTGFFCTPEVGDTISVMFPTGEENEAYVIGAVNNEKSSRFSDPFARNYITTESEKSKLNNLINDLGETIKASSMEECFAGEQKKFYDLKINEGVMNLYLQKEITEETDIKTVLTHNKLNMSGDNETNLTSKNYKIEVVETISEQSNLKKENFTTREISLTSKKETSNTIEITANTHKVSIS